MRVILSLGLLLVSILSFGQRMVSGKVIDDKGTALIGASVGVKNTDVGTLTDENGMYSIELPNNEAVLVISYVGFSTREINVGDQSEINASLDSDQSLIDEVVVVAYGIKRDKSNIGYAVTTINSEDLNTAKNTNVTNSLAGKVPGVRVSGSGGSFTGSGIIVRGYTTFLGSNQPLYVVDGIPIDNSGGDSPLQNGPSVSNRAIDLNSEDIESLTVLKGPAATSLYGSRAAAGVILVTTKKGKKGLKNRITYTGTYGFQNINRLPDYQNQYGQGTGGNFNPGAISSWGPKIDGRRVSLPASYVAASATGTQDDSVSLTAYPNNVADLFKVGANMQHNLSFQGATNNSTYRLSGGYLRDLGILDNNRLDRYNLSANASTGITERLTAGISANYSFNKSRRTQQGNQLSNPLFRSYFTPRSWDLTGQPYSTTAGDQLHYDAAVDNPRWSIYNNVNKDQIDRLIGHASLDYRLFDWLSAGVKTGVDMYSSSRFGYDQIGVRGGANVSNPGTGGMLERRDNVRNINTNLNFTGSTKVDELQFQYLLGSEWVNNYSNANQVIGRGLIVRDYYNLGANTLTYTPSSSISRNRIVGILGNLTTIYNNFATLDLSMRNDWNSTLPKNNNSYLYYSVAGTLDITGMVPELKSRWVNFAKLKANFGKVGKGADFLYATDSYFGAANPADGFGPNIVFPFNGLQAYTYDNSAGNPNLKPEFTRSVEFGAEISLLEDRLSLDINKYRTRTTDVIMNVPNSSAAGIAAVFLNAGSLTTNGIEAALTIRPLGKNSRLKWETTFNYTQFKSVVDDLAPGVANIFLAGFTTPNIRLVKGDEYGQIYGSAYLRDSAGRLKLTAAGLPQATSGVEKIGNPNINYSLGIQNTFKYMGITLSCLLDYKNGGDIYSRNIADIQRNGAGAETAEKDRFNADGTLAKNYIYEGVLPNGTLNKAGDANAVMVTAEQYYGNGGKYSAAQGFIYNTTWFRIREASLSYTISPKLLERTPIGELEFGVFGRNLFLNAPNYPHLDPEQNALGISNAQGLEFNALPQTRTFGINLRATF